ncbi:RagB/SusD family nutrient uptake outer membrane protein [Prevotella salivae]|uniref:RagB/SusD family nutrient uptake outer membrane protein n=1 Tax=Segatella salivae TaxID=228604 RepID=UPI001C5F3AAE|nr:RagB/SusD family nutrient uptake outer membrane protein [Segatella salivae]MBW4763567.1 RagB/SusD family nutrient uptake outer membrane protein [Segatella salivae]
MKRYIFSVKSIVMGLLSVALASCNLNIPPLDQFSDPDAINNVSNARSLLSSAYTAYPHPEYEFSLLGNDFVPTSLSIKDVSSLNLYNWSDREISKLAPSLWQNYYNVIAQCDALLERMDNVKTSSTEEQNEKQTITAEAKTLKALCYFQLLKVFAPAYDLNPDAPGVILKTHLGIEDKQRSSIRDCVSTIRGLLSDAAQMDGTSRNNGWLSKTAVLYLQADVALYSGDYETAITSGNAVIVKANDAYFTSEGISNLWAKDSYAGRIFAFNTHSTYYSNIQFSIQEGDYFCVNPKLNVGTSDLRYTSFTYPFVMNGTVRTLLGKYNRCNKLNQTTAYINTMRYAGAYYIVAEAYCRKGETEAARVLINHYWHCIGVSEAPAGITNQALLELILTDKQREFVGEGVNFFDLKRTHLASLPRYSQWGTSASSSISSTDYRWNFPIPVSEYRFNSVEQNAGWPSN